MTIDKYSKKNAAVIQEQEKIIMTNNEAFEQFLTSIDLAQKEAERLLDYEVILIVNEFDEQARALQKHAICKITDKLDEAYSNNSHCQVEMIETILNSSLKTEIAEVMNNFCLKMGRYIENRFNCAEEHFLDSIKKLLENIFEQAEKIHNLPWEGEINMPPLKTLETLDFQTCCEPIFYQKSLSVSAYDLPDSIIKPLILKEIKTRVAFDVDKNYGILHNSYLESLRETYQELINIMRNMVKEIKDRINNQLDNG